MLQDDGDIARGLGFVTTYAAWVEADIDDILRLLAPIEPYDERTHQWPIGRKLNHLVQVMYRLNNPELDGFPVALEAGLHLFARQNEVVHARISVGHGKTGHIQSRKLGVPRRPIISTELYQLANDFMAYRGNLIGPQLFRLLGTIAGRVTGSS